MSANDGSTVTFRAAPAAGVRPRALLLYARKLQREVARGRPFDCLIAGDAELRRLNARFRGLDQPTDVLSFPSGGAPGFGATARPLTHPVPPGPGSVRSRDRKGVVLRGTPGPLGDIAISMARARAQARGFSHSAETEIRILMLHGVLHLLGMDHASDAGAMARAEKRWRRRLGLPCGLIERVSP